MVKIFHVNEEEAVRESPKRNKRAGGGGEGVFFDNIRDTVLNLAIPAMPHNLCWMGKPRAFKGTRKKRTKRFEF